MKKFDLTENYSNYSPSYVIEIYNKDKLEEYVYGYKEVYPKKELATKDTLYDIASLTKVYTATLIYIAYEEKKIDLYDTVYNIDNNFINLKDIKIIDLLSHNQNIWTNGYLGDTKSKEDFYNVLYSAYIKEKIPTYVDVHYIILSTLLEKVYNKNYKELCIEKIFNKLNLKNTTFDPVPNKCASNNYEYKDIIIDNIFPGLIHDNKGRIAKKYGIHTGHAGIFTTGNDLLLFLKSFLDNTLLKKETINFMLKHNNTNEDNYQKLKSIFNEIDINKMYQKSINKNIYLPKPYNYMGTRYKNIIDDLNDIPTKASNNSITFSGYTGPSFTIDFDKKIIVVIMCNAIHNSNLTREERKKIEIETMNKVFNNI